METIKQNSNLVKEIRQVMELTMEANNTASKIANLGISLSYLQGDNESEPYESVCLDILPELFQMTGQVMKELKGSLQKVLTQIESYGK